MVGTATSLSSTVPNSNFRVEKYRPESLDEVSGHQDILATINRFVEANV
jgi:hypothetical protein